MQSSNAIIFIRLLSRILKHIILRQREQSLVNLNFAIFMLLFLHAESACIYLYTPIVCKRNNRKKRYHSDYPIVSIVLKRFLSSSIHSKVWNIIYCYLIDRLRWFRRFDRFRPPPFHRFGNDPCRATYLHRTASAVTTRFEISFDGVRCRQFVATRRCCCHKPAERLPQRPADGPGPRTSR